jgi:regulator of replication initiation timing
MSSCENCAKLQTELEEQLEEGFEQAYADLQKLRTQIISLELKNAELQEENERLKDWIRTGESCQAAIVAKRQKI